MCLHCFTLKLQQEEKLQNMMKPFELTEQIFNSHLKKEHPPQTQFIPISQPTF